MRTAVDPRLPRFAPVALLALAACAPAMKPVDVAALERSRPKTLLLVLSKKPDAEFARSYFVFGASPIVSVARGQKLIELNHIANPGLSVARAVGGAFATRHALTLTEMTDVYFEEGPTPRGATPPAPRPRPAADLELEIRTTTWVLFHDANDHNSYNFRARLRLRDRRDGRELAGGACDMAVVLPDDADAELDRGVSPALQRAHQQAEAQCRQQLGELLGGAPAPG